MEAEPSETEDFEARGSRFSKSVDERQRMLVQRKEDLLQQARKYAQSLTRSTVHLIRVVPCKVDFVWTFPPCLYVFMQNTMGTIAVSAAAGSGLCLIQHHYQKHNCEVLT